MPLILCNYISLRLINFDFEHKAQRSVQSLLAIYILLLLIAELWKSRKRKENLELSSKKYLKKIAESSTEKFVFSQLYLQENSQKQGKQDKKEF